MQSHSLIWLEILFLTLLILFFWVNNCLNHFDSLIYIIHLNEYTLEEKKSCEGEKKKDWKAAAVLSFRKNCPFKSTPSTLL